MVTIKRKHTLIIAEAGVNHNGSIAIAKKLVDVAKLAGADYVKFQTFKAENLVSKKAPRAAYQIENTKNNDTQFEMLKKLELTDQMHLELIKYCEKVGINFLSTPFDIDSAKYLVGKVDFFKIPSGELTNIPFLKELAKSGKPLVISTGMANIEEVLEAVDTVRYIWRENSIKVKSHQIIPDLTVLHCTTDYPTQFCDVNLNAMVHIKEVSGVDIGYSDHSLGIEVSIAATALGARVIEKHFTLDREMEGPDHKASLEPKELIQMCRAIRNIELSMGDGVKRPSIREEKNITIARKSLHFSKNLSKGSILTVKDISVKRPGCGIHPREFDNMIGRTLARDVTLDEIINEKDFYS